MLRLISVLLLLAGLGAVAFGGYRLMAPDSQPEAVTSNTAEPPMLESGAASSEAAAEVKRSLDELTADKLDDDAIMPAFATDDVVSSLQSVPIAHETPRAAKFGRPFEVTVAIDATGDDTAADALPGRGTIVESTAQVSASVEATLSGEMFEIEAITPLVQRVSPITENVWRWKVTPIASGSHNLVIELYALSDGEALPIRTFQDRVEVEVSRIGQVVAMAQSVSPVALVLSGIGSLLAGLFGVARFFRGR